MFSPPTASISSITALRILNPRKYMVTLFQTTGLSLYKAKDLINYEFYHDPRNNRQNLKGDYETQKELKTLYTQNNWWCV